MTAPRLVRDMGVGSEFLFNSWSSKPYVLTKLESGMFYTINSYGEEVVLCYEHTQMMVWDVTQ